MVTRTVAYYEARIAFGIAALLPALLLPGYILIGCLIWLNRAERPELAQIAAAFELALPLSSGLLASHLMTIEREDGFDELRHSYPETSWRLPLLRSFGGLVLTLATASLAVLIFWLAYGSVPLGQLMLPALPPAFYLLGLALLLNNLSGNYWISAAGVVGYWLLEYWTMGRYTGALFLFRASIPLQGVDYHLNRWLLVVLSLLLLAANVVYSGWRRKYAGR